MENKKKCPVGGKGIGGQAVIEGVMMRGKKLYALAVRTPKKEIVVEKTPIKPAAEKCKILGWPIIRGVVEFRRVLFRSQSCNGYESYNKVCYSCRS